MLMSQKSKARAKISVCAVCLTAKTLCFGSQSMEVAHNQRHLIRGKFVAAKRDFLTEVFRRA